VRTTSLLISREAIGGFILWISILLLLVSGPPDQAHRVYVSVYEALRSLSAATANVDSSVTRQSRSTESLAAASRLRRPQVTFGGLPRTGLRSEHVLGDSLLQSNPYLNHAPISTDRGTVTQLDFYCE